MQRTLSILASAGAALACVLAATAVPAAASSRALETIGNSNGFAGYTATTPANATFTLNVNVPPLGCTKHPGKIMELATYLQGTVTGGGSTSSGMYVDLYCNVKTPTYVVYMLDDGEQQDPGMLVSGGDKLNFSGTATASSESYAVKDLTTSQTLTGVGTGLTTNQIDVWLQATDTGKEVFPPFKKPITFSSIKVDHAAFSALNPTGYNDVDATNNLEVSTSDLLKAGTSFTLTYVSNT